MSLNVPVLDDRTYADLVQEGMQLIPQYAPEWTDHNASDPGITLLELFAYLTEMYLYRVDRSSEASKPQYLDLMLGGAAARGASGGVDAAIQHAVADMRRPYRAVSQADYERLALQAVRGEDTAGVAGARCLGRRNLEAATDEERRRDSPGHVSVAIIPEDPWIADQDARSIRDRIRQYLLPRRLLTTRVHVVWPAYVEAAIRIHVVPSAGYTPAIIEDRIRRGVMELLDTRTGGPERMGYPLGRSLYVFDLYRQLGTTEGISRLEAIEFDVPKARLLRSAEMGEVVGVHLEPWELLRVRASHVRVTFAAPRPGW